MSGLTDAQREAAIETMARGMAGVTSPSTPLHRLTLADAERALDALTDAGFLILHRDDVKQNPHRRARVCTICGELCVTRCELIT